MSLNQRSRVQSLDGLRAIAVLLVMAGHGANAYLPAMVNSIWIAPLVNASLGVRLFFVLSGFLITTLLIREHQRYGEIDWRAFVLRRSLRIWPAFYVYLLVMIILWQLGLLEFSIGQLLAASTFTWNYAALWLRDGTSQGHWFFGHLWTLALEQQFYLAWPFVIAFLGWNRTSRLVCVLPLLLPLLRVFTWLLFPQQRGLLGMMFHTAIDSILVGCLFAIFQQRIRSWMSIRLWLFPFAFLFVFILSPLISGYLSAYRITIGFGLDAVCCGLLILAAQSPVSTLASRWAAMLAWQPFVYIGTLSYSLYLWQQPFLTSFNTGFTGRFPSSFIAALACALISFYLIERPALRAKDYFGRSAL